VERTVSIHEPNVEPRLLSAEQQIDGGNVLPGFTCQVSEFFE
jgi:hypothetical protein